MFLEKKHVHTCQVLFTKANNLEFCPKYTFLKHSPTYLLTKQKNHIWSISIKGIVHPKTIKILIQWNRRNLKSTRNLQKVRKKESHTGLDWHDGWVNVYNIYMFWGQLSVYGMVNGYKWVFLYLDTRSSRTDIPSISALYLPWESVDHL